MIDVILAVDEKDSKLGVYFQMCADDMAAELLSATNTGKYNLIILQTNSLNLTQIELTANLVNSKDYLFIAYSHGDKACLGVQDAGHAYVDLTTDISHLSKSLFYTFSCHAAAALGPGLVRAGCHLFWGYKSAAWVVPDYEPLFLDCANHGMRCLLIDKTVEESFNSMIDNYDSYINSVYMQNMLVGEHLMHNRDALTVVGHKDLKLSGLVQN